MSIIIAIDGPAASGKGTLARRIAEALGFAHLDTGALYRAVGLAVLRAGGDPADPDAAVAAAEALHPETAPALLHDPDLRGDAAAQAASMVAAVPGVRAALLDFQRNFARRPPGAVLDGRDIGTVVCPGAPIKLFVTASLEARTARRLAELRQRGVATNEAEVLADMRRRDARDSERAVAPLRAAADAVLLDTSHLDADQAFAAAMAHVRARIAAVG